MARKRKPKGRPGQGGRKGGAKGTTRPLSGKEKRELMAKARHLNREVPWLLKQYRDRLHADTVWELCDAVRELRAHLKRKRAERDMMTLAGQVESLDRRTDQLLGEVRKSTTRQYVESIGAALAVAMFIRTFLFEPYRIPTGSMIPTLMVGDFIFVAKFVYGVDVPFTDIRLMDWRKPQRGEVVIFDHPEEGEDFGETLIKRIMAVAGDKVRLQDNVWYANGEPLGTPKVVTRQEQCKLSPGEHCWWVSGADLQAALEGKEVPRRAGCPCTFFEESIGPYTWTSQHIAPESMCRGEIGLNEGCCTCTPPASAENVPEGMAQRLDNLPVWPAPRYSNFWKGWPGDDPASQWRHQNEDGTVDWEIPEGYVLVLGDNRDNSADGRYWGLVPLLNIKGKAQFIWFLWGSEEKATKRLFRRVH